MVFPTGYAQIDTHDVPSSALAALIQVVAGSDYPPPRAQVAAARAPLRPATLAGVRIIAGRSGAAWLLLREEAAIGPPVPAQPGAVWDRRFRLPQTGAAWPLGCYVSHLGRDAARFRRNSNLPSAILRTLPAIRDAGSDTNPQDTLAAVPHLRYARSSTAAGAWLQFCPARPSACAPWSETFEAWGCALT
jgi:tRNA(Ile)-lysidine synthase